jgi:tripartite-type tricarboxylate transporter receptor subunit TctC
MNKTLSGLLHVAILTLVAAVVPSVQAQGSAAFPNRAVRLVVPFPPGGATDVMARMVAQKLSENWAQPVLVENKAGATGALGSVFVAKSPADGYTILMGTASTHSVAPAVNPNLPYQLKDFTPISLVATFPNMLVVHPSMPVSNVAEFIAYLKENPGKVNFASTGIGGSVHLAAELFKLATKTEMVHIPYKGSSAALSELLGGQVQVAFDNMSTVWPYVQSGKLRALAVTDLKRSATAPDVPTIAETIPGFEASSWIGFFAPAGTTGPIANRISLDIKRVLAMPDVVQKLAAMGAAAGGNNPEVFESFVRSDTDKWRSVARAAKVKLE